MATSAISAASLAQDVLASGNSSQQQALLSLQNNLASGDLTGAQTAFQTLQNVLQNSATTTGSSLSSNSQLSTDLTALGTALSSGDLATAQSAFATVLGDLKGSASAAQQNEAAAASQSVELVENLLSTLDTNASSTASADNTTSLLQSYYAGQSAQGGLNVLA
jgi:hypothetical protein